ncbi:MAG TPA: DUF937 domain-containing protein [Bosea sp. (in: a-proteobacteria)]|jgi:hypothetical protein|uniref:DUF937 domain-containing protein n=1 Tax=Bosea sp. (in: a-proteobacteria) TaxID=1871050 RepID=UPI002DDD79CE|nr:DUF937 domain-containing protein [Bosea sp. (in: a-proteobacteria)]HEV2553942.1 DUF937 domain-containing protein [Bosea sp. (in: a-proteobacteria)]
MMNLFEMMQQAQNGQAMENLARQYGLSQMQTQAAIEALLPAFSMGLQRQTQDPYAFGSLAQMMTASPFGRIFDANGDGIPDNARSAGTDVLSQLFGSKEVSNAVAAQAAATSGVGQAVLKQMLPVIAAMVMGGLTKSAQSNGLGGILGQFSEMMRGQMPGMQPAPQPQSPANPLEAILGSLFGNAQAPAGGQTQGGGPFGGGQMPGGQMGMDQMGGMFGQILTGMLGGAQAPPEPERRGARPTPEPEPQDEAPSSTGPGAIGLDALNQMFETGRQVQDSHQQAMKSIFDTMFGGPGRR